MTKNFTPINNFITNSFSSSEIKELISRPKESEPIPSKKDGYEIKEAVEHEPTKEVAEFIKIKKETIELPTDLKKMGLQVVTTTKFPSYKSISLPISDDKIIQGLHAPIFSSLRWLAALCFYILQQAHLSLKVVHGHVVRIMKR